MVSEPSPATAPDTRSADRLHDLEKRIDANIALAESNRAQLDQNTAAISDLKIFHVSHQGLIARTSRWHSSPPRTPPMQFGSYGAPSGIASIGLWSTTEEEEVDEAKPKAAISGSSAPAPASTSTPVAPTPPPSTSTPAPAIAQQFGSYGTVPIPPSIAHQFGKQVAMDCFLEGHDRINTGLSHEIIVEIFRRLNSKSSRDACSLVCKRWLRLKRLSRATIQIKATSSPDLFANPLARRFSDVKNTHIDERQLISLHIQLGRSCATDNSKVSSLKLRCLTGKSGTEDSDFDSLCLSDAGLDIDELIHLAGTLEYSLLRLLSGVLGNVDMVIFPNYESSVERDDIKEPFSEVSMFKKNYDHLQKDVYFGNYKEATHSNPNYFLTYGNGKTAARIQDHLRPNSAHRWHNYMKTPCEIKWDEAAVLHYIYPKYSDLTSRRDRCGCKPTKEDVKRCYMLEFDRAAFIIASTATEEEMRLWYRERIVWTDRTLNLKLLRKGILTRIYAPMVIIQSLRGSGVFSSVIAKTSQATITKENFLKSVESSNSSRTTTSGMISSRKIGAGGESQSNARSLETLSLDSEYIINKGVLAVADGSPHLEVLKLQCIKVTDDALKAVGTRCLSLENLAVISLSWHCFTPKGSGCRASSVP